MIRQGWKRTGLVLVQLGMLFPLAAIGQQSKQDLQQLYSGKLAQQRFKLSEVQLLESPFLQAEKTDLHYILQLNTDRLLAPYLREAGLPAKAQSYGNWESMGLDGHTAGHYLTALAQMYRSTGNIECKDRMDYMIRELHRCQQQSLEGYVGGIPGGKKMWQALAQGDFSLFDKKWVPWYNLHKLFAGLRDSYLIGGNKEAKEILIKLSNWADRLLSKLNDAQIRQMLRTEYGGMNAVLADVAQITGKQKYLTLAKKFSSPQFVHQLEQKKDSLTGLHANTQIPKVIGFERIAQVSLADSSYDLAARFFWHTVVENRSISFGGNSVYEHFNPTDDFSSMIESVQGPETCNSYNMLKLTEDLFLSRPQGDYMDYYERCLYNHILSTQKPGTGGFVYFTPIRPSAYRVYSAPQKDFWCCVGTGMENHGKYGEMIYTHSGDSLFVNLFIPSKLRWTAENRVITQQNNFPTKAQTELIVEFPLDKPGAKAITKSGTNNGAKTFSIFIRKPGWLKGRMPKVSVNGVQIRPILNDFSYIELRRDWHSGDRIMVQLPMKDRLVNLPDHSDWVSIMHGPIVLAAKSDTMAMIKPIGDGGRFDHIASGPLRPLEKAPILLISDHTELTNALLPVTGKDSVNNHPLLFTMPSLIWQNKDKNMVLEPFSQIHDSRYIVYWPVARPGDAPKRQASLAAADKEVLRMAMKTVDQITPGEQQPEVDHLMTSQNAFGGVFKNKHWRAASQGYFAYTLKMMPEVQYLRIGYYGKDNKADDMVVDAANKDPNKVVDFDIFINDKKIANVKRPKEKEKGFFSIDYPIAKTLKRGNSIEVKFVANKGCTTARIFDVRLVK